MNKVVHKFYALKIDFTHQNGHIEISEYQTVKMSSVSANRYQCNLLI